VPYEKRFLNSGRKVIIDYSTDIFFRLMMSDYGFLMAAGIIVVC
jgi:hypothetical protein